MHVCGQLIPCLIRAHTLHHHVCKFFLHVSSLNLHMIVLFQISLHASLIYRTAACKHLSIGNHTHFPQALHFFPRKKNSHPCIPCSPCSLQLLGALLWHLPELQLRLLCFPRCCLHFRHTWSVLGSPLKVFCLLWYVRVQCVFLAFDVCCVGSSIDMLLFFC